MAQTRIYKGRERRSSRRRALKEDYEDPPPYPQLGKVSVTNRSIIYIVCEEMTE